MALPATDNFNRANGALGADWSMAPIGSALVIVSNAATAASETDCTDYWDTDQPAAAQYAQIVMSVVADNGGPMVRCNALDEAVIYQASASQMEIYYYSGGSWTKIGSTYGSGASNSDLLRAEASGTAYVLKQNGTSRVSGSNASAPATGYGGMQAGGTTVRLDDFEVGNLAAGGVTKQQMHLARMRKS